MTEQDVTEAYDKAHKMFHEGGWTFDADANNFRSPDKRCSIDLQTAIMCLVEDGEDTLKELIDG